MASSKEIIKAIDEFLEINKQPTTTPPEVNAWLDRKGILSDSASRAGSPLRKKCRNGEIPHAFQNGSRWIIPHSGNKENSFNNKSPKTIPKEKKQEKQHKLEVLARWLLIYLKQRYGKETSYRLEYKPDWLLTYPKLSLIKKFPSIRELHFELVNGQVDLEEVIIDLPDKKLAQQQSYDIWIGEPFNFAVEFDEKQHFNQFRKISLKFYQDVETNYLFEVYANLNAKARIKPGKTTLTKLGSKDAIFPELLPGEKQDNRIRQRAFRDYLKDLLPLANKKNPTLRIPYQVMNKKVKNFNSEDLKRLRDYLDKVDIRY
ncbi:hypothetical protein LZ575_17525 [Antarcticibacterium sp. 1MA-6-2]|uniref:hypothetical protein n=1 Tax=Antarcticibacterium sp. 1MA-6-2 TaxID=2908210 RepID=UPI001F2A4D79|nr:hypothetical protein [Antarcticibacterium sp. 1MA-6-2]UJH90566.1 hypothetical protein LZ575_17525 [Antarcticibacterium sp. 1MA-6-2]